MPNIVGGMTESAGVQSCNDSFPFKDISVFNTLQDIDLNV